QCSSQWCAVMRKLWEDRSHFNLVVGYRQLCRNPEAFVQRILREACGQGPDCLGTIPRLHCFDDEYRRGAPLRSKNEVPSLDRATPEPVDRAPVSEGEIARITRRCGEVEDRFEVLTQDVSD